MGFIRTTLALRHLWPFGVILSLVVAVVWALSVEPPQPSPEIKVAEQESHLTERCKDWLFYRNRAYKLARKGDTEGAAEAGDTMRLIREDLRRFYSSEVVTDELTRLEASGYKAGF